jgi:hypothetical protein
MTDGLPNLQDAVLHSDGFLHILGPNNSIIQSVQFAEMIPISLEALAFTATSDNVNYLTGSVTFRYAYYKFI